MLTAQRQIRLEKHGACSCAISRKYVFTPRPQPPSPPYFHCQNNTWVGVGTPLHLRCETDVTCAAVVLFPSLRRDTLLGSVHALASVCCLPFVCALRTVTFSYPWR